MSYDRLFQVEQTTFVFTKSVKGNSISTWTFVFSELLMLKMFLSTLIVFQRYKYNLVECLMDGVFKICSTVSKFNLEVNLPKRYIYLKGFPIYFVLVKLRWKVSFLRNPAIKVYTVTKKNLYISMPMISHETNLTS